MDIFFRDPNEIPLPPDEVRIQELRAEPWPDGRRVRIICTVDPFQKRPSLDLAIFNSQGEKVSVTSVVESMTRHLELNMHMRRPVQAGEYKLDAVLFYTAPVEPEGSQPVEGELPSPPPEQVMTVVDQRSIHFSIEE